MIAYLHQRLTDLLQRWDDFIHERAIRAVQDEIVWIERNCACTCEDYRGYGRLAELDRELRNLESKRSPKQLARMKGRGE